MLLSMDVGFKSLGWVLFEQGSPKACGVIRTEKSAKKTVRTADDNAERAAKIARELRELIERHGVKACVGELPSGGAQSARAISQMSMAVAVVAAVTELSALPTEWCTPGDVKKAMIGRKDASKDEIMEEAKRRYPSLSVGLPKASFEHIADAVGAYEALKNNNLVRIYG